MKFIRVIPRLDIKGPNVVKGINFEGLRVLGKPEDFACQYYEDGADELLFMDVVASLYGRNNLLDIVKKTAEKIFIPLIVGGGIRTVDDVRDVLRAGADKVAINTAAINNPDLITRAAKVFGSQCIVVSIEAKQKDKNVYEAYTDNGRERTGVNVFEWAKKAHKLGAGEILITSVDREGTGEGYDMSLLRSISDLLPIPVIGCGGAGSPDHFCKAIKEGRVDAVAAASVFHYGRLKNIVDEDKYKEEGNVEYLRSNINKGTYRSEMTGSFSIAYLKSYLDKKTIPVRI